ncbi:LVIVD repeat-containing protein, partial [Acidobacteriota bacterium]
MARKSIAALSVVSFLSLILMLLCPAMLEAVDGDALGFQLLSRHYIGQPNDVVVSGTTAYVALDTGIEVLDVTNPDAPQSISDLYLPGPALDIKRVNNTLYIAGGETGLQIVDASNPSALVRIGSMPTDGTRAVFVSNDIAYLAETSDPQVATYGLRMVDVSTPSMPAQLGFLPTSNGALTVTVDSGTAYVGLGSELAGLHGMLMVNVTDPGAPLLQDMLRTDKPVYDIMAMGNQAILATGFPLSGSIITVNLINPLSANVISSYTVFDSAYSLGMDNNVLHVAAGNLGMMLIDAADLANLSYLTSFG